MKMGGAGSARPQCRRHANPNVASFGHHALANEPVTRTCRGLRPARICGRGDRAPPRKSPFASFPGLPRKATLARIAHPAEGRARHAREDGITRCRGPSFWLSAPRTLPVSTTCFGSSVGRISGRAERIPPRKRPSAPSRAFPR